MGGPDTQARPDARDFSCAVLQFPSSLSSDPSAKERKKGRNLELCTQGT